MLVAKPNPISSNRRYDGASLRIRGNGVFRDSDFQWASHLISR